MRYLLIVFIFLSQSSYAQYFNSKDSWKSIPYEASFGPGVCNYIGDLGGSDGPGSWFIFKDLEYSQFKQSYTGFFRYNFHRNMSARASGFYGQISGADDLTGNPLRNNRNLSFFTKIYELAAVYEYHILRAKPGNLYGIKGTKGMIQNPFGAYAFLGVGGFHFNPKAEYEGSIYELQPLGTEGQGIPGQPKKYSLYNVCIPFGMGAIYRVYRRFKLEAVFSYRYTFTDYIDDVSTFYYDENELRKYNGDIAVLLADRSPAGSNPIYTTTGAIRGNPKNNDGYLTFTVQATYNFVRKSNTPRRPSPHPFKMRK